MNRVETAGQVGGRAIVIGASMAGLCAARVLSDRVSEVVVVDRDALPDLAEPRARVPQGRHPHLLLNAGTRILTEWFPGIVAELAAAGAVEVDVCRDFLWHQSGGYQRRPSTPLRGPSMSRPLLEHTVRQRTAQIPNVSIRPGTTVSGVGSDRERSRLTGVVLEDGTELPADLIVDATGRQARSVKWLANLGFEPPTTDVVDVDTTYVSRRLRRRSDPGRDWLAAAVIGEPASRRLCMALPIEDDQWIVMIGGVNGEAAPADEVGMLAYSRTFDSPVIAHLLQDCEPTGPIETHRFPNNQRRRLDRMRRFPLGWLLLGDSVCSFDPIYGQGMTSAALQAEALAACLDREPSLDGRFTRAYFKAATRAVAAPWSIAVGGDFAYPGTTGTKPLGTDLLNRYIDKVVLAGQRDDAVVVRFNEVVSLVRRSETLLAPSFVVRVLRTARRVRRDHVQLRTGHPTAATRAP